MENSKRKNGVNRDDCVTCELEDARMKRTRPAKNRKNDPQPPRPKTAARNPPNPRQAKTKPNPTEKEPKTRAWRYSCRLQLKVAGCKNKY